MTPSFSRSAGFGVHAEAVAASNPQSAIIRPDGLILSPVYPPVWGMPERGSIGIIAGMKTFRLEF